MLLNSKYPILVPSMNRVSDVRLAVACHQAGIYPSLSFMSYVPLDGRCQFIRFEQDIRAFIEQTGTKEVLISVIARMLENSKFLEIVKYLGLKHIEIVDAYQSNIDFIRQTRKENGFNIILKTTHPNAELISEVDGVILKGPEGAGTSFDEFGTIQHMVSTVGNQFPNKFVVATGGIGTAQQVKELIDLGANMVGVGTRYAVSEESSISHETKLKMIDASWNDVTKIQKSSQNALIFKTVEDMRDDENNTRSLEIGVKYGHAGHVFAGKAIDNVTAIKTVKEITEELTKDL